MTEKVKIIQLKHSKMIDFKESDLTEGIKCLMRFLIDGERHFLCNNIDLDDENVLKALDEHIDGRYYQTYPKLFFHRHWSFMNVLVIVSMQ